MKIPLPIRIKSWLLFPKWLFAGKGKPWSDFVSGLLPHEHVYSPTACRVESDEYQISCYHQCTHPGCDKQHLQIIKTAKGVVMDEMLKEQGRKKYDQIIEGVVGTDLYNGSITFENEQKM